MAKYADKDASSWLIAIVTARKDKQDFLDVTELITGNLDNLQRAMQLQLSIQLPTKADFHHPFDMEAAAAKVLELSGEQDVTAGLRKLSRSNKQADRQAVADLLGGGSPGSGSMAVLDALAHSEDLLKNIGDKVDAVHEDIRAMHLDLRQMVCA